MIHRRRTPPVIGIATSFAADIRLTAAARGLFLYMMNLPDGAEINPESLLPACRGLDVTAVDSLLEELRNYGYLYEEDRAWVVTDMPGYEEPPEPPKQVELSSSPRRWQVVYFVEREGLIKIGLTGNLKQRLKSLNAGGTMPPGMTVGPVKVLATEPGDWSYEQELHERFAKWRIARTEWFKRSKPLMDYINEVRRQQGPPQYEEIS